MKEQNIIFKKGKANLKTSQRKLYEIEKYVH